MVETFDVAVVGVGAMGAAACHHLAGRGVSVLGLEQFDIAHDQGSSGGDTRLIRMAYFEHPDYVPLLRRAYAGFDELEARTGRALFQRTGLLYVGEDDGEVMRGTRLSAAHHHIPLVELTPAEVASRYPALRMLERQSAVFEPDAGFVRPEQTIVSCVTLACAAGASVRARERVTALCEHGDRGVRIDTDRDRYEVGHVVLTAGAWTGPLCARLGVPLRVTRQPIGWVWPRDPVALAMGRFPCFAIEDPTVAGLYYGFPCGAGDRAGMKVGHHAPGRVVDPDRVDRAVDAADEDDFRAGLRRFLPAADGPLLGLSTCLYTSTPDGHFVVGRLAGRPISIAAGFSGHGFKFAPVIGEVLADLALDGRSELPIAFLAPDRFAAAER